MKRLSRIFSSQFLPSQLCQPLAALSAAGCLLLLLVPINSIANATQASVQITSSVDQKVQTQLDIDALHLKITTAEKKLGELNKLASTNEKTLAQAQKRLSDNQKQQRQLQGSLTALTKKMHQTNQAIEQTQASFDQQQSWIAQQLQKSYKYGQNNALKLVLSGQSPSDTARFIKYNTRLNQDQQSRLADMLEQQNKLDDLQSQQLTTQQSLTSKQRTLARIEQQQSGLQKQYQASQVKVKNAKKTTFVSLKEMRARTQMLESVLQDIIAQEEIAKATQASDFSKLKGQLAPPIQGKQHNTYKTVKADGSGQWRGIWIEPKNKRVTEVLSIADGHVVFADWLLGYGLLTIIDHGHGYFSLYGHTQTLLRQPGDWVTAKTPIAVIRPVAIPSQHKGLYFEIREKSQALNPVQWLAS